MSVYMRCSYEAVSQRIMDHLRSMPMMSSRDGSNGSRLWPKELPHGLYPMFINVETGMRAPPLLRAALSSDSNSLRTTNSPYLVFFALLVVVAAGEFMGEEITLGARADSLYEYLLKQWLLSGRTGSYEI